MTQAGSFSPLFINAGELSALLGVSERTVWRMLSKNELIAPVRFGGSTRWRLSEIEAWIEGGCCPPGPDRNHSLHTHTGDTHGVYLQTKTRPKK